MDEIKRYDAVCMGYDDARFEEEPEGEWVTYSDHKAALADKEAELQAEREKVAELEDQVIKILDEYNSKFMRPLIAEKDAELAALRGRLEGVEEVYKLISPEDDSQNYRAYVNEMWQAIQAAQKDTKG